MVQIITGREQVDKTELKVYEWYVLHDKCPIHYTGGGQSASGQNGSGQSEQIGMNASGMQRIIGLSKMKVQGPKGDKINKLNYTKLEHLDPVHNHERIRDTIAGWNQCDFDIPEGVIFRLHVTQKSGVMGRQSYSSNLFFRVRACAPYLQVHYKDGHGLPYLLKGRLDRLSAEYVIQHQLMTDTRFIGTLGEVNIERFIQIDQLEGATQELPTSGKITTEVITVNGATISRNRTRPTRKVIR